VFDIRPENFELLTKRLERMANRIVLGVLAAALSPSLRRCFRFTAHRDGRTEGT